MKTLALVDYGKTSCTNEVLSILEDVFKEASFSDDNVTYYHIDKPEHIAEVKGDVVIAMGADAMRKLCDTKRDLKEYAGSMTWNDEMSTWIIPTYHPNGIYQERYEEFDHVYDVVRRAVWLCKGELPFPDKDFELDWEWIGEDGDGWDWNDGYHPVVWTGYFSATQAQVDRQHEILTAWLARLDKGVEHFACDTESFSLNHYDPLIMVQVFDPVLNKAFAFNWGPIERALTLWQQFFNHPNFRATWHNQKHDDKMIHHWFKVPFFDERHDDTMAWCLGLTEKGNQTGLKYAARQYAGAPFWDEGLKDWLSSDRKKINFAHIRPFTLAKYGCADTFWAYKLRAVLPGLCEREGTTNLVRNILLPAQRAFAEIEYEGIRIDVPYSEQLAAKWAPIIDNAIEEVQEYARQKGFPQDPSVTKNQIVRSVCNCVPLRMHSDLESLRVTSYGKYLRETYGLLTKCDLCRNKRYIKGVDNTLNVRSSTQMAHLCHDMLDMVPTFKPRQCDKQFWTINAGTEFADLVIAYRELDYLQRNFVEGMQNFLWEDGRVHPDIFLAGTVSGRLSMKSPALQTVPSRSKNSKFVKRMFLPDKGDLLVNSDFKALEMFVTHHLTKDDQLLEDLTTRDIYKATAQDIFRKAYEEVTAEERTAVKPVVLACVPLDSEILTRRGWLKYDEVCIGDETLGYNPETGQNEWTFITRVQEPFESKVHTLKNGTSFKVTCTADHKWVVNRKTSKGKVLGWYSDLRETSKLSKACNLVLSAPAQTGEGLPITDQEAALIGWIYTDGHLVISPLSNSPGQGSNSWRRGIVASVVQSKQPQTDNLRELFASFPHTEDIRPAYTLTHAKSDIHVFRLRSDTARGIWNRAGLWDGISGEWVTRLSPSQREAFLDACVQAEGFIHSGTQVLSQNEGPVCDAIEMAGYLSGYYVRKTLKKVAGSSSGNFTHNKDHYALRLTKPTVTCQKTVTELVGTEQVWCVTTDLGTWTMRQGNIVTLTGNSGYNIKAGKLSKNPDIRKSIGGGKKKAQEMLDAFWNRYKVWDSVKEAWKQEAVTTGVLTTEFGRKRRWSLITGANMWKVHNQATNFKSQSTGSDVTLTAVIKLTKLLREKGWGRVVLTVHDSILFSIHRQNIHEAVRMIEQIMCDVPIDTETPFSVDTGVGPDYAYACDEKKGGYDPTRDYMTWSFE